MTNNEHINILERIVCKGLFIQLGGIVNKQHSKRYYWGNPDPLPVSEEQRELIEGLLAAGEIEYSLMEFQAMGHELPTVYKPVLLNPRGVKVLYGAHDEYSRNAC